MGVKLSWGEIEVKVKNWVWRPTFLVLVIFVSSVCFCIDLTVGNVSSVRSVFALFICSINVRSSRCSGMFGLADGAIIPFDSTSPIVLGGNATLIPADTRD